MNRETCFPCSYCGNPKKTGSWLVVNRTEVTRRRHQKHASVRNLRKVKPLPTSLVVLLRTLLQLSQPARALAWPCLAVVLTPGVFAVACAACRAARWWPRSGTPGRGGQRCRPCSPSRSRTTWGESIASAAVRIRPGAHALVQFMHVLSYPPLSCCLLPVTSSLLSRRLPARPRCATRVPACQ